MLPWYFHTFNLDWFYFLLPAVLEFCIDCYLQRYYNKRGIKSFQKVNETERLNKTQLIASSEGNSEGNKRNLSSAELHSVNRFSLHIICFNILLPFSYYSYNISHNILWVFGNTLIANIFSFALGPLKITRVFPF